MQLYRCHLQDTVTRKKKTCHQPATQHRYNRVFSINLLKYEQPIQDQTTSLASMPVSTAETTNKEKNKALIIH